MPKVPEPGIMTEEQRTRMKWQRIKDNVSIIVSGLDEEDQEWARNAWETFRQEFGERLGLENSE